MYVGTKEKHQFHVGSGAISLFKRGVTTHTQAWITPGNKGYFSTDETSKAQNSGLLRPKMKPESFDIFPQHFTHQTGTKISLTRWRNKQKKYTHTKSSRPRTNASAQKPDCGCCCRYSCCCCHCCSSFIHLGCCVFRKLCTISDAHEFPEWRPRNAK